MWLNDQYEALKVERDALGEEIKQSEHILDQQATLITHLNLQHASLQKIVSKYQRKSATRFEKAIKLGKRNLPNEAATEKNDFQGQTENWTNSKETQCFTYLNEFQTDSETMKEKDKQFMERVEETFKLLMISKFTTGESFKEVSKKNPVKSFDSAGKGFQDASKAIETDEIAILEPRFKGMAADRNNVRFDGNLSSDESDKEAGRNKMVARNNDPRRKKIVVEAESVAGERGAGTRKAG